MKNYSSSLKGSVFIAISALFFASYGIWSRLMNGVFGEFNQAWIRALILLFILLPFGFLTRTFTKIKSKDLSWFVLIALAGGLNQAPYFYGFEHLPIGTATLLFYLMLTVGAYLIGKLFFNEKITILKYISLLLAIIGLFIIYQFSLNAGQIIPALASMVSGLLGACVVVFSKKLSSNYSETQILTGIFIAMFLINLSISCLLGEHFPSLQVVAWFGEIGYTIAMVIANIAVIAGFRYLEPSIGGIIGLLEVILAAIFGILFFGEVITIELIIGSLFILLAAGLADFVSLIKNKN
ncbi:DMT family transporter [Candidatus Beckwithbacteria bacterium]|nr:DMT family transporter [Candidatus Beckwithbacteria bacterium]